MLDEETKQILLQFLEGQLGRRLRSPQDFEAIPTKELLEFLDEMPDELLPLILTFAKTEDAGKRLFQQLMGDHEPELQELSDRFFNRYSELMLEEEEPNPLFFYLPPETWVDLGFVQTRHLFFVRQTMAHILEFLNTHFESVPDFQPCDEELAWSWFFQQILTHQSS